MFNSKPFKWAVLLFAALIFTAGPALAQSGGLVYHECQVFDELNRPITNITTVTVRLTGTTDAATIYADPARTLAITQPITTTSTNTTLASGKFYWYGPDAWDYTIGDGTNTMTNYGHSSLTATNTRIIFPTYLAAVTSTAYTDAQSATFGSDADFVLAGGATAGRFTVSTTATDESPIWWFGADTAGVDVMFFAATTGDYILWDASDEQLEAVGASILVDDGSIALGDGDGLLFGDTLGTGDFKISDESDVLTIDVVVAGTGEIAIGNDADDVPLTWYGETTGDTIKFTGDDLQLEDISLVIAESTQIQFGDPVGTGDVTLSCASNVLTIGQVVAGTGSVALGVDDAGVDLKFYGDTASSYILWDASGDELLVDAASIALGDGDAILFGDTLGTGDFSISDISDVLTIDVVVAGTGEMAIGNDADDVPMKWYGETTGDFVYFTGDDLQIEDISLCIAEGTQIQFGDALGTGDVTMSCSGNVFTFGQVVAGTGSFVFGADDAGVDVTFYGDTASQKAWWDASGNEWFFGADAEGVDVTFYADTTGDYVKWDEDSANEALTFVGANLKLDSDSGIINAPVVVTDAATYAVGASSSGKTLLIKDLAQNTNINLPAEAAGLYYKFIYVGAADESHDHTIDSENNTNFFIGGVAFADTDAGDAADEINAGVYSDGNSNSQITINNASAGTVIEVYCDGTNWYISGIVFSDTVPAFADN